MHKKQVYIAMKQEDELCKIPKFFLFVDFFTMPIYNKNCKCLHYPARG